MYASMAINDVFVLQDVHTVVPDNTNMTLHGIPSVYCTMLCIYMMSMEIQWTVTHTAENQTHHIY